MLTSIDVERYVANEKQDEKGIDTFDRVSGSTSHMALLAILPI
jgi:hypothetical protein